MPSCFSSKAGSRPSGEFHQLRTRSYPRIPAAVVTGAGRRIRQGAQPGDVHLRDAKSAADLRLRQAVAKVHHQDGLLTRGQLAPVRADGLDAEHVVQPRILTADAVG